ncbi:right-handed parallel beta-helix repeat-containing protein [Methanobrevibacter smithii]|uniref:right-handed parallel beta-helix repeat-containing protein n=1 Tax=Methanobrevibacter smithii TaxID=2173 RepID=UPI00384BB6EF
MFKDKFLIFIILIIALLSISVASAEDVSSNATDTQESVILTHDDLSTKTTTSTYDENTSLEYDNSQSENILETYKEDVNFSNENTLGDVESSDDTAFSNNDLISSNEPTTQNNIIRNEKLVSKSFTQLKEEIELASDTLTLDSNYKMTANEENSFKNGISIFKNINIDGNGFTIDANNLKMIFKIGNRFSVSLSITISNCNLVNCAFYNYGSDSSLTVNNCNFINGSIESSDSSLIVRNCNFVNSRIYNGGYDSSLIVRNCSFINNTAYNGGCAIYNSGSGLTVNNCSFINNTATNDWGSAIYNSGSGLTVNNCSFINNTANNGAGAIYNTESGLTVNNCSFINNTANNGAGAIYNSGSGLTVNNCSFINNTANNGGAIHSSCSNSTIVNCNFINNIANNGAGAIHSSCSNSTISSCNFINNTANHAGAIYNAGSDSTMMNCNFINNIANNGGAIYNTCSDSTISSCNFINNTANNGGAIYNFGSITVSNSKFKDNNASKGVAIYNDVYSQISIGTINLNNNTYSGINNGKTYIYNIGTILTPVTITVLENKTVNCRYNNEITLFATITTSFDGASVAGGALNFIIGRSTISTVATSNDNGTYNYTYKIPFRNISEIISASYNNASNAYVYSGILDSRNVTSVNIIVNNVVMIYKDGSRLYATLLDAKGNPLINTALSFTINGATYNKTTDLKGIASIALNLEHGIYNAVISYAGNKMYKPSSVNSTVTIKSSITGQNIVKMYQNDTRFYAKFIDSTGKALTNTEVKFNIHGVFYTKKTDKDGVADMGIMLRPGTYILTAYNPVTGEEKGFNITVRSLIVQNDLTKYYSNASKFQATIYNKDGSLAVGKNITFNINGVFYTKTTDSNGVASLGIALRPENYTITTMYDGLDIGNKVKVIPTLVTKDLNMKHLDGSNFTALTLDGQGKPLANQNISFNVNGVFYHKVTNKDGIASLGIRLMSGEYIITSYWNNFQTGNTIKINP